MLWKAKKKSDGQWVEGFVCQKTEVFGNIKTIIHDSKDFWKEHEVDEKTLCRKVEFPDCDKTFWENDIITDGRAIGVITYGVFNKKYIGFSIYWEEGYHDRRNDPVFWLPRVERIGNVFDN